MTDRYEDEARRIRAHESASLTDEALLDLERKWQMRAITRENYERVRSILLKEHGAEPV
ncbi:MAG: hypothetical protein AB7O68_16785 [Pirellulales bacterium]